MEDCSVYDDNDPFASMFLPQKESIIDETLGNHTVESYEQPDFEIKREHDDNQDQDMGYHDASQVKTEDEENYYEVKLEPQDSSNSELFDASDALYKVSKPAKKKGRPVGAKTGTGVRSGLCRSTKARIGEINATNVEKLPKMRQNVQHIRLTSEQVDSLKKLPCFFQPGVCFQIAPKLDHCKACWKSRFKHRRKVEVECRFYQFRKLRYVENELEVAGFLDPHTDPVDIDKAIWTPISDKLRFKTLSLKNARFILTHVGIQLCHLVEKEKEYYKRFKTDSSPIIWKRLIDSVIEICDLCSTTLFNYHFICTKCGLSLCVDCVTEAGDKNFDITCSNNTSKGHCFEDLSLTQIIVAEAMEKLQVMLHDTCDLWEVDHNCDVMKAKPMVDQATKSLVKNLIFESKTGKTVITRELDHRGNHVEVDFNSIKMEDFVVEEDLSKVCDEYLSRNSSCQEEQHCLPIKNLTNGNKENVVSISRSMSQITSNMFYPKVPHRWLCENKLLRLLDPLNPGNDAFFNEQWQRGQPVLVSNMLNHLKQELWIPQAFSAEFGHEQSDFINCMTGKLVRSRDISIFWDGFENVEKRLKDSEGKPMLLKLKDWPPDSDFKNIMPSRFEDVMKNLPLNAYTNRTGDLNIVKYLPSCFLHPDLGPKGYFAYGSPFFLKEGTTNLHLDISDACNVMCYIGFPRDKNITMDEFIDQGFKAILEADCDFANVNRVIEDGEVPGAIWHIYEASDADRIRDFLLKIAQERGFQVADDHDVIHDQNWYLDGELRARLFKEYGVKGYSIVQCLGDCIVLPAGTPHQVRNIYSCIKIAEDFVSPQQVAHCLNLSNQFRRLTKTHTNNEEKLNIRNVAYHSVKEAIATLANLSTKKNYFSKHSN